jgi:hypothetical protein
MGMRERILERVKETRIERNLGQLVLISVEKQVYL